MGTAKRERQKANRQQRLEELAREARKDKTKKRGLLIGVVVVGGLALLFLIARLWSGDDGTTAVPTTVAGSISTDITTDTTVDPAASTTEVGPTTTAAPTTTAGPTTTVAKTFAYGTAPCPEVDGSSELPESFEGAPQLCIDSAGTYTAEVVTDKGSFTISLDTARSPGNVNNFVTLARYGYYDDSTCHRVLEDFVVQCGRPALGSGADAEQAAEEAPGYSVPDELPSAGEYAEGTIAIANTGQPDTGGGQFFIITGPEGAGLPPQYTIVGTVTKGLTTTVQALENLADPLASNGVPPLVPISIGSITITED